MAKILIRNKWSMKDIEVLKNLYPNTPTIEISKKLYRSVKSIYCQAHTLGLKKTNTYLKRPESGRIQLGEKRGGATCFKKGHTPHNKGKIGWQAGGNANKTKFKKGHTPQTWVPVGSERISKDGILERKVSDVKHPKAKSRLNWRSVHSIVWEEHNGPIPDGYIVVFKKDTDDKTDIEIDNLELISRAENMRRNSIHNLPKELVLACQAVGVLNRKINRMVINEE